MSIIRVSVEHAFKDIKKYFTNVDVPRKLCVKHTPVGLWYFGAAILWNFTACLCGSQSATNFDTAAATLEEYVCGESGPTT